MVVVGVKEGVMVAVVVKGVKEGVVVVKEGPKEFPSSWRSSVLRCSVCVQWGSLL